MNNVVATKYLTSDDLSSIDVGEFKEMKFCSADSINEKKLLQKILSIGRTKELFAATAQMAIIGFGGRDFQEYMFDGDKKQFTGLFDQCGVLYNNGQQTKLKEDDITPRRLIRIFREQIHKLLCDRTDLSSYLFRKYTTQKPEMRVYIFPGAENFVEKQDQVDELLEAYKNLDETLENQGKAFGIGARIYRVLSTRLGVISQ